MTLKYAPGLTLKILDQEPESEKSLLLKEILIVPRPFKGLLRSFILAGKKNVLIQMDFGEIGKK